MIAVAVAVPVMFAPYLYAPAPNNCNAACSKTPEAIVLLNVIAALVVFSVDVPPTVVAPL